MCLESYLGISMDLLSQLLEPRQSIARASEVVVDALTFSASPKILNVSFSELRTYPTAGIAIL